MTTNALALDVRHVRKVFEKERGRHWPWHRKKDVQQVVALDDVSLRVAPREIYGILGPNGSGKSTLIRCISTLLLPDAGTIRVFGHDVVREERIVKELINRVSVEASFFKKLSPMENLMFGARLYGLDPKVARHEIVEVLTRLGLEKAAIFRPMEKMSRGMQQKVAVARALLTRPRLLLLDEPTTGLDPRSKREVQAFVRTLRDRYDTTVVLTTHDMDEAERLCDRIAIIDRGRIVAEGTLAELKAIVRRNGHEPTLEDVFMALTGRALSDEQENLGVGGVA